MSTSDQRYLLTNDAPEAMDRFTAFATLFDPVTFRHFERVGLSEGWRCWEVGAGGTSVVRHLSEQVGPAGQVVASDINVGWATEASAPNVAIVEHDVAADPPSKGPSTWSTPDWSSCTSQSATWPWPTWRARSGRAGCSWSRTPTRPSNR